VTDLKRLSVATEPLSDAPFPPMRHLPLHILVLAALTTLAGCPGPSHHVRRMGFRRTPRTEICSAPALQVHTDRGPDRPFERYAVVTAECRDTKEAECQEHLRQGGCEAEADALIEVSNTVTKGRRRMIGMAIEYTDNTPAVSSAGGPVSH
jgi:hypothetical protein